MRMLLVTAILLLTVGCSAPSINLQITALRTAGDVSVSIYLDDRSAEDVPRRQKEIKQFVNKIHEFLDTGNVAALSETKLKDGIVKLIPLAYREIGESLLDSLTKRKMDVDLDFLSKANIARIKAFFQGAGNAVDSYNLELRKAEEAKKAKEAAKEDPPPAPDSAPSPPTTPPADTSPDA